MLVNAFKYINEMLNRVTKLEVGGIKKWGGGSANAGVTIATKYHGAFHYQIHIVSHDLIIFLHFNGSKTCNYVAALKVN